MPVLVKKFQCETKSGPVRYGGQFEWQWVLLVKYRSEMLVNVYFGLYLSMRDILGWVEALLESKLSIVVESFATANESCYTEAQGEFELRRD